MTRSDVLKQSSAVLFEFQQSILKCRRITVPGANLQRECTAKLLTPMHLLFVNIANPACCYVMSLDDAR